MEYLCSRGEEPSHKPMKRNLIIIALMSLVLLGAACGRKSTSTNTSTTVNVQASTNTSFDTNDGLDQALEDLNQADQ